MKDEGESHVRLSIVVPVYNEEANLPDLDREIRDAVTAMGISAEVLYIDDGSTDDSNRVLKELAGRLQSDSLRVRVVTLRQNFGQTAALAAGFDLANGEVIVPLDGDLQNDPADIAKLLRVLEDGFDVVSGWRKDRKDRRFSRRLPSWVANKLVALTTGLKLHDYGCTLKAYRTETLKGIRLYGSMHRFIPAYLAARGARVSEVIVNHRARLSGTSKYGPQRFMEVALDMVLLRFMTHYYSKPMQFFGHTALTFTGLAAMLTGFMVVFKYGWLKLLGINYQASFVETPLPSLVGTLLVGALLSLFFGILAEVLIRVHHEAGDMKPYTVREIHDSGDDGSSEQRLG